MPMNPRLLRPVAARDGSLTLVFDTSKEPANLQVSVPLNGTVNCTINWGDGSSDSYTTTGFKTHTYASAGVYTVRISGTMTALDWATGPTANNRPKLVGCLSFGSVGLTNLTRGFRDCRNLTQCPPSLPAGVTNLSQCFWDCVSFNDSNIGRWNTSAVTNMTEMFVGCSSFNADISAWNTSAVTAVSQMFFNCISFNANLSAWKTSLMQNMFNMFFNCDAFDADLSAWDLSGLNSSASLGGFMSTATGLSTANYNALLIGWESRKSLYRSDLAPNFGGSKYTAGGAAATARAALVTYGWTITDGGTA